MKKERNTKPLQRLVDFANLDLERIEPGDRAKLLIDSSDFDWLWPGKELKAYDPFNQLTKQRLSDFSWALEIPGRKSPEYWNALVAAQKAVRDLFAYLQITAHRSPEAASAPSTAMSIIIRGHDEVLWWLGKGPGVPYTLRLLPVTKSQEDYLRLKIFRFLEGFNQHAITRCPGCGQWFFNPTDRKKRFCGNRCIWRTNTAKRRAASKKQKGK
jgi:hypothetical protein